MSVTWNGLEELKAAMENLPADLTAEASHIVEATANAAAADIKAAYPVRTGNLRDHVVTIPPDHSEQFGARAHVKSTAKHAHLFEVGTQAAQPRHTAIGANRGAMPPGNIFVPVVVRRRAQMYQQLMTMLQQHGLLVTGEP